MTYLMRTVAVAAGFALSTPSGAATLNHVMSWDTSGTPDPAALDITIDTDLIGVGRGLSVGLTVNSLNFAQDGDIVYDTSFSPSLILIYDDSNGRDAGPAGNDFFVFLRDWSTTSATLLESPLVQDGQGLISTGTGLSVVSTDVTPPAIPLPAAAPLLAGGLAAIGLIGWRRVRRAA